MPTSSEPSSTIVARDSARLRIMYTYVPIGSDDGEGDQQEELAFDEDGIAHGRQWRMGTPSRWIFLVLTGAIVSAPSAPVKPW